MASQILQVEVISETFSEEMNDFLSKRMGEKFKLL
jgi:hypothetical protein